MDLHNEKSALDTAQQHNLLVSFLVGVIREVRVARPDSVEESSSALGAGVKVRDLLRKSAGCHGRHVENAKARAIVGQVGKVVIDVKVVVNAGIFVDKAVLPVGILQVLNVPDEGASTATLHVTGVIEGGSVLLIQLIVHEEAARVGREPSLVGVLVTLVRGAGEEHHVGLIRDVNDGEGVLVVVEGDLLALVLLVGSVVHDDLRVVRVAVVRVAGHEIGFEGVANVHDVQAAVAV
mmetsp:Transcript_15153/g.43085  ORF Transcript_15153/g.43085 Transcript_15153/m.43085 type:complete len:236 (+) Transcript_15153:45-752(+)